MGVAVAVLGAGLAAVTGAASVAAFLEISTFAAGALIFAGSLALSFASQALAPKPKIPALPDLSSFQQDNLLTVRQAAAAHSLVFGRCRAGGYLTFIEEEDPYIHMIVTVAGHPVSSFDALLFDGEVVPLDGGGEATGKFAGLVRVRFGLGTTAGDAGFNAALTAALPARWTSEHRQSGRAKAYLRLKGDSEKFPNGIPNISFIVTAYDRIEDPRQAGSPTWRGWSDNAALCIAQYLRDQSRGLGYVGDEIDETALIAAANACDEMVARLPSAVSFTVDSTTGIITLADTSAGLRCGTRFQLRGAGSPDTDGLPSGYQAYTHYFWDPLNITQGRAATTLANARARVTVTPLASGSGILTVNAEPRYTLNGVVETDEGPEQILPMMLSAMAGRRVNSGGAEVLYAGIWYGVAEGLAFDEDDSDGPISTSFRRPRRTLFNGVKGTFVNPDDNYQPTDFPAVSGAAYIIEDGERIWKDAELRFTDSPSMAQRIARIDLERNRRQITGALPLNLRGLKARAGSTIAVTNEKRGWDAKEFDVVRWEIEVRGEGEAPRLGTTLGIEEVDANVYAWDETIDEQTLTPSPLTNLPTVGEPAAPTALVLQSGTDVLGVREDGTVFSRILATWTAPADIWVTSGGTIEVEFRKTAGSPSEEWRPYGTIRGDQTQCFILDVDDGEAYEVRLRSRNAAGIASDWVSASHTVIGKTDPASDPTGYSVQQNGNVTTHRWDANTDRDLAGSELRYMAAPFVWEDAIVISSVTRGTLVTNTALPPGAWVCGLKHRDTSGNYSANAATFAITVINANNVVAGEEQGPRWPGLKSQLFFHHTGRLVPGHTVAPSTLSDAELWDEFCAQAPASAYYEASEIDLGFDAMAVRIYSEISGALGPGETGSPGLSLAIDTRLADNAYDGFDPWTIGTLNARYVKARAVVDTADGVPYLEFFKPQVDAEDTEQLFTAQAVAAGGTHLAFSPQFHLTPHFEATAQLPAGSPTEARFVNYANLTTTGVDVFVLNIANQSVAGAINGTAKGP